MTSKARARRCSRLAAMSSRFIRRISDACCQSGKKHANLPKLGHGQFLPLLLAFALIHVDRCDVKLVKSTFFFAASITVAISSIVRSLRVADWFAKE
eukprot:5666580-Pleurochrysis_carterae.AAC.4